LSVSRSASSEEMTSSEHWSICLVGVDIGVGVEPTVNDDGVDEPAVTAAEDGDGPRIEDGLRQMMVVGGFLVLLMYK
jgi:hypothetical protein